MLPTVAISSPANGTTVSTFSSVTGTASENAGGSGLDRVDLYFRRNSDNRYGTGSAWRTSTPIALTTVLSGTTWMRNINLPSGANLPAGSYFAGVYSYDKAGNASVPARNTFTVGAAPLSTLRSSSVALSSATARVTSSQIVLSFSGALDANTATEVARFGVQVNGNTMIVESAAFQNSSVVLGLPEAALKNGDRITVTYDLLDASGRSVTGKATFSAS